jgi:hypothetical protein
MYVSAGRETLWGICGMALPQAGLWYMHPASLQTLVTLMPKGIKKANLPSKTCATCGKPFAWRKKWEKVWDNVKYCSNKCRNAS